MIRSPLVVACGLLLVADARAAPEPKYGKVFEVEFTKKHPTAMPLQDNGRNRVFFEAVTVPVAQGDRFRIQMTPVGGVVMNISAEVSWGGGKLYESSGFNKKGIDWTMEMGISGRTAKITLYSAIEGTVSVRISRLKPDGEPYATPDNNTTPGAKDDRDELIKKLQAENAELRKRLDDQNAKLDVLLDLVKKLQK